MSSVSSDDVVPVLQGDLSVPSKAPKQDPPKFDEKDQVEVPLTQFLTLLSAYDKYSNVLDDIGSSKEKEPPRNTMIQEMDIEGKTEKNTVSFKVKICILVLVDKYTKFRLFNVQEKLTVLNYLVQKEKSQVTNNDEVMSNYFEQDEQETTFGLEDNVGFIGVFDNAFCLHTNEKGRYHVTLNICVPYQSDQKNSVDISFPFCAPRNHLRKFEVDGDYYDVQVEPATSLTTRFEEDPTTKKRSTILSNCSFPPSYKLSLYWTRSEKLIQEMLKTQQKQKTTEKKEEKKEEKQLNISVDQNVLHSVGGGLISTTADLKYNIANGSVNTFYVLIQLKTSPQEKFDKDTCPVRVLRVDGRNIKQWEIKKLKSNTTAPSQQAPTTPLITDNQSESNFSIQLLNSTAESQTSFLQTASQFGDYFLKITLDCGVEGNYDLKLLTERDMKSESCKVHLPSFSCMNVNRDKGFVGVEGIANIEINELRSQSLTKLAPTELPYELQSKASDSLLYGYKFLSSLGQDIFLDVKKHDDVAVLVAVIEECVYEVTYSESGYLYYRVAMKVKNSSQTYIRVDFMPKDVPYSLYSTSVMGEIVRPAIDKDGKVLIPLKRGNSEMTFSVEMFYTVPLQETMNQSGKISIILPKFNIPTNRSFYNVFLPTNYHYGEFEGSMKEITSFSVSPTVDSLISTESGSRPSQMPRRPQMQMQQQMNYVPQPQMQMQQMQMNYMQSNAMPQLLNAMPQQPFSPPQSRNRGYERRTRAYHNDDDFGEEEEELAYSDDEDNISEASESDSDEETDAPSTKSSGLVSGVMPVKLFSVKTGKRFLFEKMLVSENEDHLKLSVEYKKEEESFLNKRTLLPVREIIWGIYLLIAIVVLYILYAVVTYMLSFFF